MVGGFILLIRHFTLILICALSCSCSLYRSDARKFLEKQAFEFAGVALQANLLGCPSEIENADWTLTTEIQDARIYVNTQSAYEMQVIAGPSHAAFSCTFRFSSEQEMVEKTEDAVKLTIFNMGQSLAQFAFSPISPLK